MVDITPKQESEIRSKYATLLNSKPPAYHAGMIRAAYAAELLSDSINEMGFEYEVFGTVLAQQHRTLQQDAMRAFMAFVKNLSHSYEENNYDGRNKSACELAFQIERNGHHSLPHV
jgi:hypothetical protein